MQFLAIVHDLDQSPSWKAEWIEAALSKIFIITEKKKISTICLPVMGIVDPTVKTTQHQILKA